MRIYIAGPVHGVPYSEAVERFKAAEQYLYGRGDNPVNPMKMFDVSWSQEKLMRTATPNIFDCDGVYMLHGWKADTRSKLEHFIALKLGIKIELEK
jgi:hypothetical protein